MENKERRKRRIHALFALIVCVLLCVSAQAAEASAFRKTMKRPLMPSVETAALLSADSASADALLDYLRAQIWAGETEITVNAADYGGMSFDDAFDVFGSLLNYPDMFFVLGVAGGSEDETYTFYAELMPEYEDAETLYQAKALYQRELNKILETVNPAWTPLQKLLYLNSYICMNFDYDYREESNGSAYAMLRDGVGVCQAYTELTKALLDDPRVNIPCVYVWSDGIEHMWNIVRIDGSWYHMDVTWNDPDGYGGAEYSNFLLSDAVMQSEGNGHADGRLPDGSMDWGYERKVACDSTRFDNYFWRDTVSPILSVNGQWYLVSKKSLQTWDGVSNSVQTLLRFSEVYQKTFPETYARKWTDDRSYVTATELFWLSGTLYFHTNYLILAYEADSGTYEVLKSLYAETGFQGRFTECVLKGGKLSYAYRTLDANPQTVTGELGLSVPAYQTVSGGLYGYYEDGGVIHLKLESGAMVAAVSYDERGKMTDILFLTEAGEYKLPKAAKTALISMDATYALRCAPVKI